MTKSLPRFSLLTQLLVIVAIGLLNVSLYAAWDEIPIEDIKATSCRSDPSAPAEILYKQQIVDQQNYENRHSRFHLRIKLYDESAVEQVRTQKIRYDANYKLRRLSGRVIKANGETIELEKKDIFKQVKEKSQYGRKYSKSFSFPRVEVGDIVEYKYSLNLDASYYLGSIFASFQEKWPIRKLDLKIYPFGANSAGFKWISYNCNGKRMKKKGNGFYEIEMSDVSAYPEEPLQFPDSDARAWFWFYNVDSMAKGDRYWEDQSRRLFKASNSLTKPGKTIQEKAKSILAGISDSQMKLEALYDYCRSEMLNSRFGKQSDLTPEERQKVKKKDSAEKVLKRGYGNPYNINVLFCSLARSAGFDARLASVADRSRGSFKKNFENVSENLPYMLVAVHRDDSWEFLNPGFKYLNYGEVNWKNDAATALVPDKKKVDFQKIKQSLATDSKTFQHGKFELHPDGMLTGDVSYFAHGNHNFELKSQLGSKSEQQIEEFIEKSVKENWPNVEVSDVTVSHLSDVKEPAVVNCHVSIPRFAEVVGDRIFFHPCAFRKNDKAKFIEEERKTNIFFPFTFSENDKVEIKLPDGYGFEQASAPHPFNTEKIIKYNPKIQIRKKSNTLVYTRDFEFHLRMMSKDHYKVVKNLFDTVYTRDQHMLTLKKIESTPSS